VQAILVQGSAEGSLAFHGLGLLRAEALHPPRTFDPAVASHLDLVQVG
jgi:hypothetical protein